LILRKIGVGLRRAPILPLVVLGVVVLSGALAPLIAPYDPNAFSLGRMLRPPFWADQGSTAHWLGTDTTGRDVLSRLVWGARVSLIVGFAAVFLAGGLGTALGLISGYARGWLDVIIMRWVDIQQSVPTVLLQGLLTIVLIIGFTGWISYARIIRGEVLSLRERDYVALAKVAGCSQTRILLKHLLPNVMNTVIVLATLQLGTVIILEATLSFLGLGVQPPTASWGQMLSEGRKFMSIAWWLTTFPGVAIMVTVLGFNLLGDWLRDTLDPKRRQV